MATTNKADMSGAMVKQYTDIHVSNAYRHNERKIDY